MHGLHAFVGVALTLAGCYGGPLEPVLVDVCDGHLEVGKPQQTNVGDIGGDVLTVVAFDDVVVVNLDGVPSDFVAASRTDDDQLLLDPRAVGVGYLKIHISAPEGDATWAWFLLDVREAPVDTTACEWTTACRRTYAESQPR
jgi:hypothetical protein